MKVLLVSTSDIGGGAALAAYRLRDGLRNLGTETRMLVRQKLSADDTVIPWPEPRDPGAAWLDELTRELSSTLRPRTPASGTYFSLPWPGEDVANHPAVQEADVLNLHWSTSFIAPEGLRNLLLTGKPVVLTLHDQRPFTGGCHYSAGCTGFVRDCDACPQLRAEFHRIARCALALSKACLDGSPPPVIVTPSRWLADEARRSALFSHCRVEPIPNGLNLDVFRPTDRAAALEYFGLPAGARVVLFGAHTLAERRKGFDVLQEAINRLLADDAAAARLREQNVVFASYGLKGGTLRATGLPLYLLGEQPTAEDMARLLSASSLFVCPTREDNLPNTVMEAMACGLPVLASHVGGVPDMITDGVHGKLVPPGDPAALAAAVMEFAERPGTWLQWGVEGRRKCEAQYPLAQQGSAYTRLFNELMASRREPIVETVTPASIAIAQDAMNRACKHLESKLREEEEAGVRREEEATQARIAAEEAAKAAAKAAEPNPKADLARVEEELRKRRRNPFCFLLPRGRALKRQRQALKDEIQQQKEAKRAAKRKPKPDPAPAPARQPDAALGTEGGPLHDALLVISASEINGHHGTGVLLGRLLKDAPPFIHLRSMNLYGGKSEAAQRICVPIDAIAAANVPELLNGSTVRRILSVPYDRSDVENTLAFHDATGAPLCVWLMDHNLGEGRRQIPYGKMKELLDRAQLRLGISSEFCELYRDLFGHDVHFAPPVVDAHLGQRTLLHLPAQAFQPPRGVLLGNVWSHIWMKKLVEVLTKSNVPMVAFGNMSPPDVKNEKLAALLQARGYLPEPDLVTGLRQHPFALVPTGTLDEEDDLPSIARYSLPSRTLYLSAVGNLPIIVMGHADTGVARFVTRHGLGIVVPYDARSLREAVEFICDPDQQMRFRRQAAKLAPSFACDDMGDWLWKSLDMRGPADERWREFSDTSTTSCHP